MLFLFRKFASVGWRRYSSRGELCSYGAVSEGRGVPRTVPGGRQSSGAVSSIDGPGSRWFRKILINKKACFGLNEVASLLHKETQSEACHVRQDH